MLHGKNNNYMFEEIYKNKKVLVTGHTGFKGTWLVSWLLKLGADVAGYSIGIPTTPSHFVELNIESKIKHFIGDIRNYDQFYAAVDEFKPEFIFHLAAQPLVRESYLDPKGTFEVNMSGTLNILETIRHFSDVVKVAVIITSDKAYDNVEWLYGYREDDKLGGEDPYSGSKGAAELIIRNGSHPEQEIDKVTTPKGCTIVGLNEMEHSGFELVECCIALDFMVFNSEKKRKAVILKWADGMYGISIHGKKDKMHEIKFCPWCGSKLGKSGN